MIDSGIFRQVFEEMEDPAFFHDAEFRLIFANAAYYREAGTTEDASLGKFYWEVFPKGSRPLLGCNESSTNSLHSLSADEFTVAGKSFISRGYLVRDEAGESMYSLHILSDISKRVSAEKALEKIAAQFKLLFDISPDAIMLSDETGFLDCNAAALEMFGCKYRSDFVGKHPSEFSPPFQPNGMDSSILAKQQIADAFKNGSNFFEWMHCKPDGTTFPVDVLLIAFEKDGKPILQGTVRDISARKKYEHNLAEEAGKLNRALAATINTMSKAMELRDPYTAGHQSRVAVIACAIAEELGWEEYRITGLRMASLIHDIGKIGIPSEILTKPSKLSEFEEKLVQLHPGHGYELLKDIEFPWAIADMVHQHHERIDGSGYPLGLTGDKILPEAKVLAVADMLEAMATNRPYRFAMGLPLAIAQLQSESGKQLDAEAVAAAVKLFGGKETLEISV